MDLTSKFLAFTLLGAQWVLWLLIALSVISVAIMIERALTLEDEHVSGDVRPDAWGPNLLAQGAIFLLRRN